jgi:hypothetical protein
MTGRERPKLASKTSLTWRFTVERVTESNPHYQLGNLCDPGLSHGLTCEQSCPWVTVRDRSSPGLMAG